MRTIMWESKVLIVALSCGISAQVLAGTVPEASSLIWHSITFGQSTDVNFATNVLQDKIGINETLLADGKSVPTAVK
jgi:hypothetical protein